MERSFESAQIDALNGRSPNIRAAADEHRTVISQAVAEASRLASQAGGQPNTDEISRTFETLSLQVAPSEAAGRLTTSLQPLGFEALAGVVVHEPEHTRAHTSKAAVAKESPDDQRSGLGAECRGCSQATTGRSRRQARTEAAIEKANAVVVRARAAEARARTEWESRQHDLEAAEQELARLHKE